VKQGIKPVEIMAVCGKRGIKIAQRTLQQKDHTAENGSICQSRQHGKPLAEDQDKDSHEHDDDPQMLGKGQDEQGQQQRNTKKMISFVKGFEITLFCECSGIAEDSDSQKDNPPGIAFNCVKLKCEKPGQRETKKTCP
jgi:hypothetical protein